MERGLHNRSGRRSSWGRNPNYSTSIRLWMEFRTSLRSIAARSLGVISKYIRPQINEHPLTSLITQPLSARLEKSASPPPQAPVVWSSGPTEPPPSFLFRHVPQLRRPPRTATPDPPAYPFEIRQQPHDTTLTVSVMIAMPTPPITKSHKSSEDRFPPVQFGVTYLPTPEEWAMDVKSSSG